MVKSNRKVTLTETRQSLCWKFIGRPPLAEQPWTLDWIQPQSMTLSFRSVLPWSSIIGSLRITDCLSGWYGVTEVVSLLLTCGHCCHFQIAQHSWDRLGLTRPLLPFVSIKGKEEALVLAERMASSTPHPVTERFKHEERDCVARRCSHELNCPLLVRKHSAVRLFSSPCRTFSLDFHQAAAVFLPLVASTPLGWENAGSQPRRETGQCCRSSQAVKVKVVWTGTSTITRDLFVMMLFLFPYLENTQWREVGSFLVYCHIHSMLSYGIH